MSPGVNTVSYKLQGDTNERFIQQDDGTQIWGSGAAAGDVILKRSGAGQITLTGNLVAGAQTTAPTVAAGTGYSAMSMSAAATDTAGQITWTSTAVGPTDPLATVTFGATHAAAPKAIMLTAASTNASLSTAKLYTKSPTATGFVISGTGTDTATTQVWAYQVAF